MKNITNLNLINLKPTIVVSHECLQAIKYIVSLAPQEAQWFHTVTPTVHKQSPGEIFLNLSTKLYIPKQNTSVTQVDTNSSMMIEFYQELKEEYQDQAIVNQKLNSMTCWCHSHHNMSPNPSGQDDSQFNQFVNLSIDQRTNAWQIMLIFNKKDQFYSRVYDPTTGLILEGVDIQVSNASYDFNYISKAAKEKFIKPKPSFKWGKGFNKKKVTNISKGFSFVESSIDDISWADYFSKPENNNQTKINESIANEIIEDLFPQASTKEQKIKTVNLNAKELYTQIHSHLDDQELLFFSFIVSGNTLKLKNFWSEPQVESYMNRYFQKVMERVLEYFSTTQDTIENLNDKLSFVFTLTDSSSREEFNNLIKLIG